MYVSGFHIHKPRKFAYFLAGRKSAKSVMFTVCVAVNPHPCIWNSLPAALRTATLSPLTFARHLKAHLFGWSTARPRTIYDALYKSTHHHHHHHPCIDNGIYQLEAECHRIRSCFVTSNHDLCLEMKTKTKTLAKTSGHWLQTKADL